MLDSGASANFISSKLADSLSLQYYNTQQFPVRLANGQMLHTYGSVVVDIVFGSYLYSGIFFVLNCDVPLILGMQFLSDVRPQVDFSNKLVSVCHNKVLYKLLTTRIVSGQQYNQQVDVQQNIVSDQKRQIIDDNMFSGLDIGDDSRADVDADVATDVDVVDNIDIDHDRFQSVPGYGRKVTHSHFSSSKRGACCALCGVVVDDDQQYCGFCHGAIYSNNCKDCTLLQQGDIVQMAQFIRDGRK